MSCKWSLCTFAQVVHLHNCAKGPTIFSKFKVYGVVYGLVSHTLNRFIRFEVDKAAARRFPTRMLGVCSVVIRLRSTLALALALLGHQTRVRHEEGVQGSGGEVPRGVRPGPRGTQH